MISNFALFLLTLFIVCSFLMDYVEDKDGYIISYVFLSISQFVSVSVFFGVILMSFIF